LVDGKLDVSPGYPRIDPSSGQFADIIGPGQKEGCPFPAA
jgi:hypothetical protein